MKANPGLAPFGLRHRMPSLLRPTVMGILAFFAFPPAEVSGQIPPNGPGYAMSLSHPADYLRATPPGLPTGNSPYTIEAWIKTSVMNSGTIAAWGNFGADNQVNGFRLTPNGLVNYWWGNDLTVTTSNLAGLWHHVAATFDGMTRRIFLDGAFVWRDFPGPHNASGGTPISLATTAGLKAGEEA